MTSSKKLAIAAAALSAIMIATGVSTTQQLAYALTDKTGSVTWLDCFGNSKTGALRATTNTPPTTQSTYLFSNWPDFYNTPKPPGGITCDNMNFSNHLYTMIDSTQGWTCQKTTTSRIVTITWTFCSSHSIAFNDLIQPRDAGQYFGANTGTVNHTVVIPSFHAT